MLHWLGFVALCAAVVLIIVFGTWFSAIDAPHPNALSSESTQRRLP